MRGKPALLMLGNIAIFGLGIAGGSLLVSAVHFLATGGARPLPAEMREQYQGFIDRKDEIEIVFIGSSITKFGIIPSAMSRPAYNLGVVAYTNSGIAAELQWVLAQKPKNLDLIAIEAMTTSELDRSIRPYLRRWAESFNWRHLANVSAGLEPFRANASNSSAFSGWLPIEWVYPESKRDPAKFSRRLLRKRRVLLVAPPSRLESLVDEARARGIRVVFFNPPNLQRQRLRAVPMFDFDDPARYPDLFAPEDRADPWHYATSGARKWSARIDEIIVKGLGHADISITYKIYGHWLAPQAPLGYEIESATGHEMRFITPILSTL